MNELLFVILLFASITLLVWGIWSLAMSTEMLDRRKLRQRLDLNRPKTQPQTNEPTLLLDANATPLERLFARYKLTAEIRYALKQSMPDMKLERFMTIVGIVFGLMLIVFLIITGSFVVSMIAAIVGGYVPFLVVARKRIKRQKMLSDQLPDGLDFLGRSLRAGHSFPVGLQMMGTELPKPLCEEFGRCHDEISLGTDPEAALKGMIERIDSTDFAFFVTAVLVQRQTGGDLAQVLDNITEMLRQRVQLQQQVKAKTAEGRFTGYILAAFPMVMFVLMYMISPENAGLLITTFSGKMMLAAAMGLSVIGLVVIKKITCVKI